MLLFWFNGMSLHSSVGGNLGKSRCLVRDPSEFSVMLRNLYGSLEGGGGASMDASVIVSVVKCVIMKKKKKNWEIKDFERLKRSTFSLNKGTFHSKLHLDRPKESCLIGK